MLVIDCKTEEIYKHFSSIKLISHFNSLSYERQCFKIFTIFLEQTYLECTPI